MTTATAEKLKACYEPNELEHMMGLVAYHIALVATEPAPAVIRCGIDETVYRITIEKGGALAQAEGPVWDQVYIALPGDAPEDKGTWCGNRRGGASTLAHLYADAVRKVACK